VSSVNAKFGCLIVRFCLEYIQIILFDITQQLKAFKSKIFDNIKVVLLWRSKRFYGSTLKNVSGQMK